MSDQPTYPARRLPGAPHLADVDLDGYPAGEPWGYGDPDGIRDDNTLRAGRALHTLIDYAVTGADLQDPIVAVARDLVADLMHLADAQGIDFAAMVRDAGNLYDRQLRGKA